MTSEGGGGGGSRWVSGSMAITCARACVRLPGEIGKIDEEVRIRMLCDELHIVHLRA